MKSYQLLPNHYREPFQDSNYRNYAVQLSVQLLSMQGDLMKCQELINKISLLVTWKKDIVSILRNCFREIAKELEIDHICVVKFDEKMSQLVKLYEYKNNEIAERDESSIYQLDEKEYLWVQKQIVVKEPMNFNSDDDTYYGRMKNFLHEYDVGSLLAMPICINTGFLGVLVLSDKNGKREWSEIDSHVLITISALIAQLIRNHEKDQQLRNDKIYLETTLNALKEAVITVDSKGHIMTMNQGAELLTEWLISEVKGRYFFEIFRIIDKHHLKPVEDVVSRALCEKETFTIEGSPLLITKEITEKDIESSVSPMIDDDNQLKGAVVIMRDISERRMWEEKIQYLSKYDYITGLYNRGFLETVIEEYEEKEDEPVAVIMGDLNGLKMTNDIFGHQVGDAVLKAIGGIIERVCQEVGIAGRWGGDEFLIFLKNADETIIRQVCSRIKDACVEADDYLNHHSISLGYAVKNRYDDSLQGTIKRAEDFMYQKKLLESRSLRSSIVTSIQQTLFEKSYETEEHCTRLKRHSVLIGEHLNLTTESLNELELIATLHDIGKIVIGDEILKKPGALSDDEWLEMKKHPEIGYRILQSVPELTHLSNYVLCHHERWDGKGYPRGLKGVDIPLLSRIISVVDAYDAMTHDRIYRKGMPASDAIEELKKNAGEQFDPEIVWVFINNVLGESGK